MYANPRTQKTLTAEVNVKQYTLSISSSAESIIADESFTATVSGGKAGSKVSFTLTGDGELSSGGKTTSTTFDKNGQAKITVKGSAPYNSTIILMAKALGNSRNLKGSWESKQERISLRGSLALCRSNPPYYWYRYDGINDPKHSQNNSAVKLDYWTEDMVIQGCGRWGSHGSDSSQCANMKDNSGGSAETCYNPWFYHDYQECMIE